MSVKTHHLLIYCPEIELANALDDAATPLKESPNAGHVTPNDAYNLNGEVAGKWGAPSVGSDSVGAAPLIAAQLPGVLYQIHQIGHEPPNMVYDFLNNLGLRAGRDEPSA